MFTRNHAATRQIPAGGKTFRFRTVLTFLMQARATRLQRLHLTRMDDATLHDIGLTRDQVAVEASRPVWDVPAYWRR